MTLAQHDIAVPSKPGEVRVMSINTMLERRVLEALSEQGETASSVREQIRWFIAIPGASPQQLGGLIRSVLCRLRKRGFVRTTDKAPLVWARTASGTVALERCSEAAS